MARVRNHAAEYAALKARAQAAGLSTRAYRRARKAEPAKYYAPRAQVTLQKRASIVDQIVNAHASRGHTVSPDVVEKHVRYATPEQRNRFSRDYVQWEIAADSGERIWLDDDDYDDLGFLLYYRD